MKSKKRVTDGATPIAILEAPPVRREPTHEEISALARKTWEHRGRPHGQDAAIWFEAERRLRTHGGLDGADADALADTRTMLGEPTGSIEDMVQSFGEQPGSRSATSL
jgi:DUF2934 family protein